MFHITNRGVAKARQYGVEHSAGEYIAFVDPDDMLPFNSIEKLYLAITYDVDIVIGASTRFYSNGVKMESNLKEYKYNNIGYLKDLLQLKILTAPWGKLFRRKLFNNDSFPDFKRSQDFLMNIDVATRSNGSVIISENIYNYRADALSSSLNTFIGSFEYYKHFCTEICKILKKNNVYKSVKAEYYIASLNFLFVSIKMGATFDEKDSFILKMRIKV